MSDTRITYELETLDDVLEGQIDEAVRRVEAAGGLPFWQARP